MFKKFNPNQLAFKGMFLIAVPLVVECVFILVLRGILLEAEAAVGRYERSRAILTETSFLSKQFYDLGLNLSGYKMTHSPLFGDRFDQTVALIPTSLVKLSSLVDASSGQQELLKNLKVKCTDGLKLLTEVKSMVNQEDSASASSFSNRTVYQEIRSVSAALDSELMHVITLEREVENKNNLERMSVRGKLETVLLAGAMVNVMVAAALAVLLFKSIASRLSVLKDNSLLLAAGKPLRPPIGGNDEITQFDRVFRSMAASLLEASRKERAMVENAVDVICSIDTNRRFIEMNPACRTILGYPIDELLEGYFISIILDDDKDHCLQAVDKLIAEGQAGEFETRMKRKDGKIIYTLWSAHWSETESLLFCVIHEITERKEAERMKREVVAMVSHDLRTPLNTVRNTFEMLEAGIVGELSEAGKTVVQHGNNAAERMLSLANDLLEIDKIQSGMLELHRSKISLAAVFEQALKGVESAANRKQISIIARPTNLVVDIDSNRIEQVLVNLLSNAIKFSASGEKVFISAELIGDHVTVRVADRGRGIPEQWRDAVFDRFKQVEHRDSGQNAGAGLGLAICKALVEMHGGRIWVESVEQKGSTFFFTLPYGQA